MFRTNYYYNKIKSIIIRYNNKLIYKSKACNKINNELEINIKNINSKKFRKIKKTKFIIFKRKFLNNDNWFNFIENDIYQVNIFLDPIMDRIEINIIDVVDKPNNFSNKCIHHINKVTELYSNDEDILLVANQSNPENCNDKLIGNINKFYAEYDPNENLSDKENSFGNFDGNNPNIIIINLDNKNG